MKQEKDIVATGRLAGPIAIVALLALVASVAAVAPVAGAEAPQGKVNVNTATAEQLQHLPRVGPTVAKRIIEFRDKNGRFKAPEELILVPGIGEKTFEQLKPFVTVNGETTLTEKARIPDGP